MPRQTAPRPGPASGGWAGSPQQRNNTPLIIGGAVAAAAVLLIFVILAASGGGSDGDGGGGGDGGGYTDAMRDNWLEECNAQTGELGGGICECAWDDIVQTVPVDEYRAFESAFSEDPTTQPPAGVTNALMGCLPEDLSTELTTP